MDAHSPPPSPPSHHLPTDAAASTLVPVTTTPDGGNGNGNGNGKAKAKSRSFGDALNHAHPVPTPHSTVGIKSSPGLVHSESTPLLLHHTIAIPCHLADNPEALSSSELAGSPVLTDANPLPSTIPPRLTRVPAIDLVRGLIIILMSLDHARKYLSPSVTLDPLRPGAEEDWLSPLPTYDHRLSVFGTRVVTHLAAPGFFFLMGLGAVLFARSRVSRGWNTASIVRHGVVRGGVLVALAASVLNDGIMFRGANPSDKQLSGVRLSLGVMYALGVNFMATIPIAVAVLNLTERVSPNRVGAGLAVFAILLSLATEAVVSYYHSAEPALASSSAAAWMLTFVPTTRGILQVMYPVLPWLSPALWGIGYAVLTRGMPTHQLTRINWLFAFACLFPFLVLRAHGGWGNIQVPPPPSSDMTPAADTWTAATGALIRFFTLVKYPPSLAFLLCTLAGIHAILAVAYNPKSVLAAPKYYVSTVLTVYGQSSLFFYLAHVLVYFATGVFIRKCVVEQGLGLAGMFGVWVLGLVGLFFACRRYAAFKHATEPESLWRLF
ncbi:hypothetical protein BCR44DRAFT_1422795 [Catenaria anguillulae PL171]|uniref:Heparan-alpha-glucosaminide N-acetyltransferase catalytic domain-containing protein n=1 Tax=Catenaria anguillulae PL171 TaxID=765915 RepID=A0A1Y2I5V1_9FUNG|nr:hypothetical protein BCR44DRAFT_1422795 [Catenaria anguillulae PL171]